MAEGVENTRNNVTTIGSALQWSGMEHRLHSIGADQFLKNIVGIRLQDSRIRQLGRSPQGVRVGHN